MIKKAVAAKIKVCHFADHINGRIDGVFKHIKLILENTDSNIFEHYLCFQGDEFIEKEVIRIGAIPIILPEIKAKVPLSALMRFMTVCKKYDFHVVHTHFMKPYIVAGLANFFLKKKLIYNYHGLFIDNHFYSAAEKKILQNCHSFLCKLKLVDLAIAPSVASRNKLLTETKLFPELKFYYNGGEINYENDLDNNILNKINEDKRFKIVFAGRLTQQKRVDIALNIVKKLVNAGENLEYYIFGDGELKHQLEKQVCELNIAPYIKFMGSVESPSKYFGSFDLFLLTSDFEGLPLVMWEAMSKALPILSSNVEGCGEIIELTHCGVIFDNKDIDAAVSKLKYFIDNPEERKVIGERGYKAVKNSYNSSMFGKWMQKTYLELVNAI